MWFAWLVLVVYCMLLIVITAYCLVELFLLYHYLRHRQEPEQLPLFDSAESLPGVTIQLPIYNEYYVIERLIDAVCQLDYPRSLMQIQILDDSTDDTVQLIDDRVSVYLAQGYDIMAIRRANREGFKAGALKHATSLIKHDFVAIFDADFVPHRDFLMKTLPWFADAQVGAVQCRWTHLNEHYSLITRLQAMQLNVHFTVEQRGRMAAGLLLQFNGTAGVWRSSTITASGGWSAETLTEDLDLSIRAQLLGWKIKYLEHVGCPAELPAEMNGLKSQQFRWMKGGAENARRLIGKIWQSDLKVGQKLLGTVHLLSSSIFLLLFVLGIISVPMMWSVETLLLDSNRLSAFLSGFLAISIVYYVANVPNRYTNTKPALLADSVRFLVEFPLFLAMSMGLAFHNSVAIVEGLLGHRSAFIRTPKFNLREQADRFQTKRYNARRAGRGTLVESMLALYFTAALVAGLVTGTRLFSGFHLLLALGYSTVAYLSIQHVYSKSQR